MVSCQPGCTGRYAITIAAMNAMGMFSSTVRGVGLSVKNAADNRIRDNMTAVVWRGPLIASCISPHQSHARNGQGALAVGGDAKAVSCLGRSMREREKAGFADGSASGLKSCSPA